MVLVRKSVLRLSNYEKLFSLRIRPHMENGTDSVFDLLHEIDGMHRSCIL